MVVQGNRVDGIPQTEIQTINPPGELTEAYVEHVGQQAVLRRKLHIALLKGTLAGDWIDFDGQPYLQDSGVHRVASIAGLEFGEPIIKEDRGQDDHGPYVRYEARLVATFRGRSHGDIGEASTRDPFFASTAFSRINLGNVKKKAATNAQHRCLLKLLGLGGTSWELLDTLGITRPESSVRIKGGERKAVSGVGTWTPQKKRIQGILLELAAGDEVEAGEILFRLTNNPGKGYAGVRDPAQLTNLQAANFVLGRLEEEYRKRMGDAFQGREGPGGEEAAGRPASRDPGQEG